LADLVHRTSELLIYTAPDGAVKVGVLFRDETAWLTQRVLAELFGVRVPAITTHLKNVFECFHFGNSCHRREDLQDAVLQPRRDHRGFRISRCRRGRRRLGGERERGAIGDELHRERAVRGLRAILDGEGELVIGAGNVPGRRVAVSGSEGQAPRTPCGREDESC
jgi:hypothetical protein